MPNKPWTEKELAALLSSFKKSRKNIFVEGRSEKSIRRKLVNLGLVKPAFKVSFHKKKKWTEDELKILRESKDSNLVLQGRSKESVIRMMNKLNLREKKPPKKRWDKKDELLLIKLAKEGKNPSEILKMGFLKSHTRNSIQKKMGFLGINKIIGFEEFLSSNWIGKTPKELTELWNKDQDKKVSISKTMYYLNKLKIRIPDAEIKNIDDLRKKEEEIRKKQFNCKTIKPLEDAIRWARADIMKNRIASNRDLWSGLPLDSNVLITEDEI